jgi:hypothetical protein
MAVTRKELLGGGTIAGVVALGAAPAAQAHGEDIVGSCNGTITATEPPLETTGRGAWKRTGRRDSEAFFRLLQQAPPSAGEPVGTDTIRDNSGAVVFTARGTISGQRIEV